MSSVSVPANGSLNNDSSAPRGCFENNNVWRINSQGDASYIGNVKTDDVVTDNDAVFDVCAVPNNVERYGPWAGRLLFATGGSTIDDVRLFTMDSTGFLTGFNDSLAGLVPRAPSYGCFHPFNFHVVPPLQDFFGVPRNYTLVTARENLFDNHTGDILMGANEFLVSARWNGEFFDQRVLSSAGYGYHQLAFCPVLNLQLNGTVTNGCSVPVDGTITWAKVSGPGQVTFANPSSPSTKASFGQAGDYVLRLTVDDGEYVVSDDISA